MVLLEYSLADKADLWGPGVYMDRGLVLAS